MGGGAGGVGVVLVVVGFSRGGRIARETKARREALVEGKTQLEAELRDLKTRPSVPLIAVNF